MTANKIHKLFEFLYLHGYDSKALARECFVKLDDVIKWMDRKEVPKQYLDKLLCLRIFIERNKSEI